MTFRSWCFSRAIVNAASSIRRLEKREQAARSEHSVQKPVHLVSFPAHALSAIEFSEHERRDQSETATNEDQAEPEAAVVQAAPRDRKILFLIDGGHAH